MRSGKLDRTLTFQHRTRTVSPAGTVTQAWADFAIVRAELVSRAVTKIDAAFGEADDDVLVFRIRFRDDLTTEHRVVYGDRQLDLKGILELGRRRALELRCEAAA